MATGQSKPGLPAGSGSGQLLELEVPPLESGRNKSEVSIDAPAALRMGDGTSVTARRSRGAGYQLAGTTDRQGDAPQALVLVRFHSPPFGVA